MLRELRLENLVLARNVALEFAPGLNLITGETGAGKSLIVGAVELALGGRGEASLVRQGEEKALVEALLDVSKRPDVAERLARAGIGAPGGEVLVRREIGADGRSKAFVNGQTATIAMLRDLLSGLVEMHGQHEAQTLMAPELHRSLLDRAGGHDEALVAVRRESAAVREIDAKLQELADRAAQREGRIELLRFRLAEFDGVKPAPGEEEKLRQERERLRRAEEIGESLRGALDMIYEGEGAALDRVHAAGRRLRAHAQLDPLYEDLADRLDDVRTQINEIAADLRGGLDDVAPDPERLAEVEERLVALEKLRRRFENATLADIVSGADTMRRELGQLTEQSESAEALKAERNARAEAWRVACGALTEARRAAADKLSRTVSELLEGLAMPKARLEVELKPLDAEQLAGQPAGAEGLDQVEFLLQANPGEPARPLRKVASGGELSRVMLALDIALEGGLPRRTLLFDELDQGLGGEAAERLGQFLARVAARHQVVCITHIPQVAARAERHIFVSKKVKAGRTVAVVKVLEDDDERVEELARMIGGAIVTDTARRHAEALLKAQEPTA
ncbi:MAG: DNA repair protein RecN [Candidatus Polarisedimenticolia bacterium]|nr:DNA repair protein RecN [bacterium]